MRSKGEFLGPKFTSVFVGESSQMEIFIEQINECSACTATTGCSGKYVLTGIQLKGLGGAVNMTYSCDGCSNRTATFESSAVSSSRKLNIMKSLQVAFICAGCTYQKVLENSFGIHVANNATFYRTLQEMYPIINSMLDDMCNEAKEDMKAMDASILGSWNNAVTTGDAVWLTRGFHSCNGTYTVRNYITGALLYYEHMCQRKGDKVSEGEAYLGTSASMEGNGAEATFKRAKEDGMNVTAR